MTVKRIIRFIKKTLHYGLAFRRSRLKFISALSDAEWVGSVDDKRSMRGFAIFFGLKVITWSAKKQPTV
jgi:hypothetical protein